MLDKRLKIFQMAAALNNFTRAAEELGMTQPNVTGQIRKLEEELGTDLFIRDGREIRLTPAGRVLHREAEALLALADNAAQLVRRTAEHIPSLRLGATMTAGGYVLPPYMGRYMALHPEVHFSLHIANTVDIEEKLKQHAYDLALVEGPYAADTFFAEELCRDELVIAGHAALPIWGQGESFSIRELLRGGTRFLLRENGSGTRYYFDSFCHTHHIDFERNCNIHEIGGFDAIKLLLEQKAGITVVSPKVIEKELASGLFRTAIPSEGRIERALTFLYLDTDLRRQVERFIQFIRRCEADGQSAATPSGTRG